MRLTAALAAEVRRAVRVEADAGKSVLRNEIHHEHALER